MSKCAYCKQKKGKRTCIALSGAICSECCGSHRRREIECPPTCVFLGGGLGAITSTGNRPSEKTFRKVTGRLVDYVHGRPEWVRDGMDDFGVNDLVELDESTEIPAFWTYMVHGYVTDNGSTAIEMFYQTDAGPMKLEEQQLLECLLKTRFSIFEVDDVRVGEGFKLLDLVEGESYEVVETIGSTTVKGYDLLLTWIYPYKDHWELLGNAAGVPRDARDYMLAMFHAILKKNKKEHPSRSGPQLTNSSIPGMFIALSDYFKKRPLPKLQNTDGQKLVQSVAMYSVLDRERVRSILASITEIQEDDDDAYSWLSGDSRPELGGGPAILGHLRFEGKRLKLECNSKERLSLLRKRLESLAKGSITHVIDSFEDISSLERFRGMERRSGVKKVTDDESGEPEIPEEIKRQLMREFAEKHLKSWIDMKLPILGNKTPRQVARTEKGRTAVREMLKDQLNTFDRMEGCSETVVREICMELGLDPL